MREIKFRAWHNRAGKMLESGTNRQIFSWQDEGQDITIMQFTGLKDKNRVEMFESDIFKWNDFIGDGFIGVIVFKDGCFVFDTKDNYSMTMRDHQPDEFEVIGNIFQSPELIK